MLTILVGMSGSGKDAIQRELVNPENDFEMERVVTATTRPMREGEQNGIDYHFMSRENFLKGIEQNDFIEYRSYKTAVAGKPDTWYYGSPKTELDPDKDYCIILDVQGAKDFVEHYGRENCFVVNVVVRDNVREERAMSRGSFDKSEWDRRAVDDAVKFSQGRLDAVVNFTVDNTFGSIDDATFSVLDALEVYKAHQREEGKRYVVYQERNFFGYEEPTEDVFKIFDSQELFNDSREADRGSVVSYLDESYQECILNYNPNAFYDIDIKDSDKVNALFTIEVEVACPEGTTKVREASVQITPYTDGTAEVEAIGLPSGNKAEKLIEDMKAVTAKWLQSDNYRLLANLECYFSLKEYAVQMDADSPMKPIEEMTDVDYIRLCAEASAASGKSLTTNQRELLGDNYNPLLSEIQVLDGSNQKLMLSDLPKELTATFADYARTQLPFDYGQKKEKTAQIEKE